MRLVLRATSGGVPGGAVREGEPFAGCPEEIPSPGHGPHDGRWGRATSARGEVLPFKTQINGSKSTFYISWAKCMLSVV